MKNPFVPDIVSLTCFAAIFALFFDPAPQASSTTSECLDAILGLFSWLWELGQGMASRGFERARFYLLLRLSAANALCETTVLDVVRSAKYFKQRHAWKKRMLDSILYGFEWLNVLVFGFIWFINSRKHFCLRRVKSGSLGRYSASKTRNNLVMTRNNFDTAIWIVELVTRPFTFIR